MLATFAVRQFDYPTDLGLEVERNEKTAFFVNMRLAVVEYERAQWAKINAVRREFPPPYLYLSLLMSFP